MKRVIVIGFAVLVALWSVHRTSAAVVTWEFAGQITSVYDENDLLGGQVGIGTPFSGSFAFESTTPDSLSGPNTGAYAALTTFVGDIGDIAVPGASPLDGWITVGNGSANMVSDDLGVRLWGELLSNRALIDLSFTDESGAVFDSSALPLAPPDLAAFDRATFVVRSDEELPLLRIEGTITTLVPEPSMLLLMVSASVFALARKKYRHIL
jgi:hypothetical protein